MANNSPHINKMNNLLFSPHIIEHKMYALTHTRPLCLNTDGQQFTSYKKKSEQHSLHLVSLNTKCKVLNLAHPMCLNIVGQQY